MSVTIAFAALAAAGCVKGNPLEYTEGEGYQGGAITPPGCAHTVTTRFGTDAPALATDEVGSDPTIKHVHLGIAADPRTTIAINWRTVDNATVAGKVRYGVGTTLDHEVTGLTFGYRSGINGVGDRIVIHEAHLCGLIPSTEYSYQIVSDEGHVSPVRKFHTAPDVAANPDAEILIASVGDSRDGYEVWAMIAEQLRARRPDLIVFSGDAVTFGPFQEEWEEFFAAGEALFSEVPVVSAHGNHDLNSVNYYAQFAMPGDEENFSFDYGHAHITVLNDSPEEMSDLSGKIKEFLRRDLSAHAGARWKVVSHHRPIYSASTRHGSDDTLKNEWAPIFDDHHADLVLNGHDHDYERTHPMKAGVRQTEPKDGTVYVVSGGAGAELYEDGVDVWTAAHASIHSAALIRIRSQLLEMSAFDETGASVDSFMITKP